MKRCYATYDVGEKLYIPYEVTEVKMTKSEDKEVEISYRLLLIDDEAKFAKNLIIPQEDLNRIIIKSIEMPEKEEEA